MEKKQYRLRYIFNRKGRYDTEQYILFLSLDLSEAEVKRKAQ